MVDLLQQLEKDEKGAITTILILAIIYNKKKTWGYEIKKILKEITQANEFIQDSSLYTKLKESENDKLVISERDLETPRKFYTITLKGETVVKNNLNYWFKYIKRNLNALDKLGLAIYEIKDK